jgi:hypothetical protein
MITDLVAVWTGQILCGAVLGRSGLLLLARGCCGR